MPSMASVQNRITELSALDATRRKTGHIALRLVKAKQAGVPRA